MSHQLICVTYNIKRSNTDIYTCVVCDDLRSSNKLDRHYLCACAKLAQVKGHGTIKSLFTLTVYVISERNIVLLTSFYDFKRSFVIFSVQIIHLLNLDFRK